MTLAHLHLDLATDPFIAPSEFHPFVRQFLNRYPDTPIRNEYMGGIGTVPALFYEDTQGEEWYIPLMLDAPLGYTLSRRHPRDNTRLVPLDMSTLQAEHPAFFRLCQPMYSTAR